MQFSTKGFLAGCLVGFLIILIKGKYFVPFEEEYKLLVFFVSIIVGFVIGWILEGVEIDS